MSDVTFVAKVTEITAAWLQKVNNTIFRARDQLYASSSGALNAYVLTLPGVSLYASLTEGDEFTFKAHAANTGAATLQVVGSSTLDAKAIQFAGAALTSGVIQIGDIVTVRYDGTQFQIVGGNAYARFVQSGSGAISESLQSRNRWFGYVTDYLSEANRTSLRSGSAVDIATALTSALAEHAVVFIPPYDDYTLSSKVTIPQNKGVFGFNRLATAITKAFSGDMFDMSATGSFLQGVYLKGASGTYTGKGVVLGSAGSDQRIHFVKMDDMDGACIAFDHISAGSQFSGFDLELERSSATTGTGRFAVTMNDAEQLSAIPRKFSQVETGGNCAFSFGGCNNVMISDSVLGDLAYSANSRGVKISNSRILNQSSLTITGAGNVVTGSTLNPNITLSGVGPFVLRGNVYNGTVTDSSNNPDDNNIEGPGVTYTPTWTAASVNPAIGDGTISGWYTRNGNVITATITVVMGGTTTFGTGEYIFSLPVATTVTDRNFVGAVHALDSGNAYRAGSCVLAPGVDADTVRCYGDAGSTGYSPTVPHTWASGDTLNISITYIV